MFVHSVITSDGAALLRQSKALNKKIIFVKAISSSNFETDRDRLVNKSLPLDRKWFNGIDGVVTALNGGSIRISFEASETAQTVKSVGVVARLEDSDTDVLFSLSSDDNSQVNTSKTISFVQSLPVSSISDNFGAVCQYDSEYVCQFYLKAGQICKQENGSGVWGEAERIPTKAQAKYDLLFEEHRATFDDSAAWAACYEQDEACQAKKTAEGELNQMRNEIKSLQKEVDDLHYEKTRLEDHERACASYPERSTRYYESVRKRDFLASCKYSENSQPVQQQQQTKSNASKVNEAIKVGKGVKSVFGL